MGEFELMMSKVGCYIRNNFYFKNSTKNANHDIQTTSVDCALSCFNDEECLDGWSYQIATKKCYYLTQANMTILQPSFQVPEEDKAIGWATGLKSCSGWISLIKVH